MNPTHRIFVLAVVLCGDCAFSEDFSYAVFNLPGLNPDELHGASYAVNERGYVCGSSVSLIGAVHGAIWDPAGNVVDLGAIGGNSSEAHDLNDLGQAVGWTGRGPDDGRAFLWQDGEMVDLGTLGGQFSSARGVNNSKQIVGKSGTSGGSSSAFLWEDGEMRALPGLAEGQSTQAYAINDASRVVGYSWPPQSGHIAVYWENEQVFELPRWIGPSDAFAVNDLGHIVGQAEYSASKYHAAAWVDGQIHDLHRASLGRDSSAWGINNVGQVVGWLGDGRTLFVRQAFLWEQQGGMRTLDSMVPPRLRKNWSLTVARDINEAGQIAAYGIEAGHPLILVPFLVSPVHPTMEMAAPSPGIAGTNNTISITGATPGARVVFLYSRHGGGTRIPGCDLQQNALQLDQPTVIGTAIADSNGVASITRNVPLIVRGQTILFQALDQNECAISQLVVHEFE